MLLVARNVEALGSFNSCTQSSGIKVERTNRRSVVIHIMHRTRFFIESCFPRLPQELNDPSIVFTINNASHFWRFTNHVGGFRHRGFLQHRTKLCSNRLKKLCLLGKGGNNFFFIAAFDIFCLIYDKVFGFSLALIQFRLVFLILPLLVQLTMMLKW